MGVFKKFLIATVFITVLICAFCISSAAYYTYGLEYLDPDYYEDDIGFVFFLANYDLDDSGEVEMYIPIAQFRVPDSTSSNYELLFDVYYETTYNDTYTFDLVNFIGFDDGSYLSNLGGTSMALSPFELINLDSYPIHSDFWDDPSFIYISDLVDYENEDYNFSFFDFSELPLTFSSSGVNGGPIFITLDCVLWDGTYPDYENLTIPTYPARPLPPDPPVTDLPLNPGNINTVLGKIFETPVDTLSRIFTATNTLFAFISVFVFYMFVRFILKPIFGGSLGSDRVRRSGSSPPREDDFDD